MASSEQLAPNGKLTTGEKAAVVSRYLAGEGSVSIGRSLNVSAVAIRGILHRRGISVRANGEGPGSASCQVCGRSTRSQYKICKSNPRCAAAYAEVRAKGAFTVRASRKCERCGAQTRSKYGICKSNPACATTYQYRLKHEMTVYVLPGCTICQAPTRSEYGICSRTLKCRSAREKIRNADPYSRPARLARRRELKDPVQIMLRSARSRAKRANVPFNLIAADIVIPDICPVLGIKVFSVPGASGWRNQNHAPSLDRKVPHLGYVKGNIEVISNRANILKSDASPEELRAFSAYYANFGLGDNYA